MKKTHAINNAYYILNKNLIISKNLMKPLSKLLKTREQQEIIVCLRRLKFQTQDMAINISNK